MKKLLSILIIAAMLIGTVPALVFAGEGTALEIPNGTFEADAVQTATAYGNTVTGWTQRVYTGGNTGEEAAWLDITETMFTKNTVEYGVVTSGTKALQMKASQPSGGIKTSNMALSTPVNLPDDIKGKNGKFTLTFDYTTKIANTRIRGALVFLKNDENGDLMIYNGEWIRESEAVGNARFQVQDADGKASHSEIVPTVDNAWHTVSLSATAPADAEQVQVVLALHVGAAQRAWYDNVAVTYEQPALNSNPPVVASPVSDAEIWADERLKIDLSSVFTDADGNDLTFTATAGTVSGAEFIFSADGIAGTYEITITATDGTGEASDTFTVTAKAVPDETPAPSGSTYYLNVKNPGFERVTVPESGETEKAPSIAGWILESHTAGVDINLDTRYASVRSNISDSDGNALFVFDQDNSYGVIAMSDLIPAAAQNLTSQTEYSLSLSYKVGFNNLSGVAAGQQFGLALNFYNGDGQIWTNSGWSSAVTASSPASTQFTTGKVISGGAGNGTYCHKWHSSGLTQRAWTDITDSRTAPEGTEYVRVFLVASTSGAYIFAMDNIAVSYTYVKPENREPVVASEVPDGRIWADGGYSVDVSSVFSDPDNDALTVTADKGTLTGNIYTFEPNGVAGTYEITLTASDGSKSVSDTFTVTAITPPDETPENEGTKYYLNVKNPGFERTSVPDSGQTAKGSKIDGWNLDSYVTGADLLQEKRYAVVRNDISDSDGNALFIFDQDNTYGIIAASDLIPAAEQNAFGQVQYTVDYTYKIGFTNVEGTVSGLQFGVGLNYYNEEGKIWTNSGWSSTYTASSPLSDQFQYGKVISGGAGDGTSCHKWYTSGLTKYTWTKQSDARTAPEGTAFVRVFLVASTKGAWIFAMDNVKVSYEKTAYPSVTSFEKVYEGKAGDNAVFANITANPEGYTLKEYGFVISKTSQNPVIGGEGCKAYKSIFPLSAEGYFGIRFINTGADTVYGAPYAIYEKGEDEVILYGKTLSF